MEISEAMETPEGRIFGWAEPCSAAERWLNETMMVGVLGGYANTSVGNHQDGSNAQINSFQVGLYELYRQDLLYVSNIDAFTDNQFDVNRPIADGTIIRTATGSSNEAQWSHYSETGSDLRVRRTAITAVFGLAIHVPRSGWLHGKRCGQSGHDDQPSNRGTAFVTDWEHVCTRKSCAATSWSSRRSRPVTSTSGATW